MPASIWTGVAITSLGALVLLIVGGALACHWYVKRGGDDDR